MKNHGIILLQTFVIHEEPLCGNVIWHFAISDYD